MEQNVTTILFALLRSAVCETKLTGQERAQYSPGMLPELLRVASKHDVAHLLVVGLKKNDLLTKEDAKLEAHILKAVYRYERMRYAYEDLCNVLEEAQIPFIPLKGSVIREYYPEPWMRTSCDIDVLVHEGDLENAVSCLVSNRNYVEKERATHDVSLFTRSGIHVELHFDLVEEGRAKNAIDVLRSVWDNAILRENTGYWYEMTDAYFYFYHIAHMAKHFEVGGCGIRPFLDLWILDNRKCADPSAREELLAQGGLAKFADVSRKLSRVWFGGEAADAASAQIEDYLLRGGAYGSTENRVTLQQKEKGGPVGYLLSRVFVPNDRLRRYYPILEKHPWLMPAMQVRRWLMLLRPDVAQRTRRELQVNSTLDKGRAEDMHAILVELGLD